MYIAVWILFFFIWPLCYLSFDLRILITPFDILKLFLAMIYSMNLWSYIVSALCVFVLPFLLFNYLVFKYLSFNVIQKNASSTPNLISTYLLLSLGQYLCWVVPKSIILSVVSISTLTWFIRYILLEVLQFLHHVIMIKNKVLLPLVILFRPCGFLTLCGCHIRWLCIWWRLLQKRCVLTKFYIHGFITSAYYYR